MTPHLSSTDFDISKDASIRLTMRPRCLCGPATVPTSLWKPGRYEIANLPPGQSASIFEVAGGWNITRLVNDIEFRQHKYHRLPEEALSDLQLQVDEERVDLRQLSRGELQRLMKRYRSTP
jgi:hypothetical protein